MEPSSLLLACGREHLLSMDFQRLLQ
uniref:Uncharacterized protein n=1 Tax=Vitis vinifera TaxID=29760 RepID=F6HGW9_VITVI